MPHSYPSHPPDEWQAMLEDRDAEIDRLRADRAKVYAWMREPDWTDNASLSWVLEWINRRPLSESV